MSSRVGNSKEADKKGVDNKMVDSKAMGSKTRHKTLVRHKPTASCYSSKANVVPGPVPSHQATLQLPTTTSAVIKAHVDA